MQDKDLPNCSNYGDAFLSMVLLTLGLPTSSFADMLRIRRGCQCASGTASYPMTLEIGQIHRRIKDGFRILLPVVDTVRLF